jgi:hypothetical protein
MAAPAGSAEVESAALFRILAGMTMAIQGHDESGFFLELSATVLSSYQHASVLPEARISAGRRVNPVPRPVSHGRRSTAVGSRRSELSGTSCFSAALAFRKVAEPARQ